MADVSIDATIVTGQARAMRTLVFVSADVGYCIYNDGGADIKYSKTTDGGGTWGAAVVINAGGTIVGSDVWFDQWTPGNTGTLIHMAYFESAAFDEVFYRSLDTATDTLGTETSVDPLLATVAAGRGAFCSITKATSGYIYIAFDIDAGVERGLHRSTDGGATWSADLSDTFVEATIDQCLLFPAANTGDGNDILALYHDASTNELTLKLWDSSGAVASESAVIATVAEGVTDLVHQYGFSGSIRHSDGRLIATCVTEYDTVTADHRTFELDCTAPATFTSTEKTAITTNIDDHYHPAVFINQQTNDIYVAFNGLRDGTEVLGTTSKVYYTKSTDGGTTWSAGSTAYMEGAAGVVVQVWAPLMGPRFYACWRVGTTLVGNKVNSVQIGGSASDDALIRFGSMTQTTGSGLITADFTATGGAAASFGAGYMDYYYRQIVQDF